MLGMVSVFQLPTPSLFSGADADGHGALPLAPHHYAILTFSSPPPCSLQDPTLDQTVLAAPMWPCTY